MINKISANKAIYIDTYSTESYHEMFNSSLILMCSLVFDKVDCRMSKSSFVVFDKLVNGETPNNVNFKKVIVVKGKGRFSLLFRYLFSAFQNLRYLIMAPKNSVLIFPYNNLFGLRLMNFFNKMCKKKVLIFCHGEMEGIVTELKTGGFLHRTLIWLSHNFFLNSRIKISKDIHFSIMGEMIKKNLSELISKDKISKFICVDHPYIFNETISKNEKSIDLFCIGTVGVLNDAKGMSSFVEFVSKIDPAYRKKLHVSVTGRIEGDISLLKNLGIDVIEQKKTISRNEYNKRIENLDLLLFFYPNDSYQITASGAIMDAVYQRKSLLALNNDYFKYVFGKFGKFGCIVDNNDEMLDKLYNLIDKKEKVLFDFKDIQGKFTPQTISVQFSNELQSIGYLNF